MNLYPCTKQPPCTTVRGHRTPVCPMKNVKSMLPASRLNADNISKHAFYEHAFCDTQYYDNGNLSCEEWEPGKGPGGLWYREYYQDKSLYFEEWESGKGPEGLASRLYYENGKLLSEAWEPGKGPDGLWYRSYCENGQVSYERSFPFIL